VRGRHHLGNARRRPAETANVIRQFLSGYLFAILLGYALIAGLGEAGVFVMVGIAIWMLYRVCSQRR
jgi:uncharacterized membrane protein